MSATPGFQVAQSSEVPVGDWVKLINGSRVIEYGKLL
jgi:hypothetical protein